MVEPSKNLTYKLLELIDASGCPIAQTNGQRKFGPHKDWAGPPPPRGSEVFIGKLPRDIFEDELVPLFSRVGTIYEMRLMMDFSGSNRGYAFVTYTSPSEASAAVRQLNGYEIRPGRNIGVVKSVDNCRLYVGGIPKTKTREEVLQELAKHAAGIVDVIIYKNCHNRRLNRGFAFVEFITHRAAAMARRTLVPNKLWDQEVTVDWAEPEPEFDDEQMKKVKVLYVRNLLISTTPQMIRNVFESAINHKIERVKKIYDYAFVHFQERSHAELAMQKLQNYAIDGERIEIRWSKPVDRDIYKIQKMGRGNSKFNNTLNFNQTLMLYKNQLEKEYAFSSKDEGIGSACAGESPCDSPTKTEAVEMSHHTILPHHETAGSQIAITRLEAMCRRYGWASPVFEFHRYEQRQGSELWTCQVELPVIGEPLLSMPRTIGPLVTGYCYSKQLANIEAAEMALNCLKLLSLNQYSSGTSPLQAAIPPVYPTIISPPMPNYAFSYDYLNTMYSRPPPYTMPIWRAV